MVSALMNSFSGHPRAIQATNLYNQYTTLATQQTLVCYNKTKTIANDNPTQTRLAVGTLSVMVAAYSIWQNPWSFTLFGTMGFLANECVRDLATSTFSLISQQSEKNKVFYSVACAAQAFFDGFMSPAIVTGLLGGSTIRGIVQAHFCAPKREAQPPVVTAATVAATSLPAADATAVAASPTALATQTSASNAPSILDSKKST